jgi:hypothetical protein
MSAAALRALACEIRRMPYQPHLFYEKRREIASRLEALAAPSPCASCKAGRLAFDLDCAQRMLVIERKRLALAEALLRQAVRGARRRRPREAPPLLPLWGAA